MRNTFLVDELKSLLAVKSLKKISTVSIVAATIFIRAKNETP